MMNKKLNKIYKTSKKINIDENTKIVIMSDCHRGAGNNYDNFIKNKNIYKTALNYYYHKKFTYIELGDGDDMWETSNYQDIIDEHIDVFLQLRRFHEKKRLIMIYGNHDICKKNDYVLKKYFYKYYNKKLKKEEDLLNNLKVHESLLLNYKNHELFLLHGHQISLLNGRFWKISRFFIRHLWKNLELVIMKDPTNTAKNYKVSSKQEKKLKKWSLENNKMLVAGHTHKPIFPKKGESLYFNDGSCIHPDGITCLEIENGYITLVKWAPLLDGKFLSFGREVLEEKEKIIDFFK